MGVGVCGGAWWPCRRVWCVSCTPRCGWVWCARAVVSVVAVRGVHRWWLRFGRTGRAARRGLPHRAQVFADRAGDRGRRLRWCSTSLGWGCSRWVRCCWERDEPAGGGELDHCCLVAVQLRMKAEPITLVDRNRFSWRGFDDVAKLGQLPGLRRVGQVRRPPREGLVVDGPVVALAAGFGARPARRALGRGGHGRGGRR